MGSLKYHARYVAGYIRGMLGFRIFEAELKRRNGIYIKGVAEGHGMTLVQYTRERDRRRIGR